MSTTRNWRSWLRTNGHTSSLAMLTGQDARALAAIAACWELISCSDHDGEQAGLKAIRALLRGMQPKCWPMARELIPFAMDWSDRERLWPLVDPERELARALQSIDAVRAEATKGKAGL